MVGLIRGGIVFWIICLVVFLLLCTVWVLMMRKRGPGGGSSVDNHNALQNAEAASTARRGGTNLPSGGGW